MTDDDVIQTRELVDRLLRCLHMMGVRVIHRDARCDLSVRDLVFVSRDETAAGTSVLGSGFMEMCDASDRATE